MKKISNMKDNNSSDSGEIREQGSCSGRGLIHKRLQQFERKSVQSATLKPPLKPKPKLDSINRPKSYKRGDTLNTTIKAELENKLKQSVLELHLHTDDRPKSKQNSVVTTKSHTQNISSNSHQISTEELDNMRVIKNDSFLAALTSKMVVRNDSFTSYSEASDNTSTNHDRGSLHQTNKPIEAVSFLYKNRGPQKEKQYGKHHKKSSVCVEEPEEENVYAYISETDNYIVGAPRMDITNYSLPYDVNNNSGNTKADDGRLSDNSSPIYNEIDEDDDEHIYQVVGFHIPSEHKKKEDDFGWTNLRDPSNIVSAYNECCKQPDTDSGRKVEGSPVTSLEKHKRALRDLAKELTETEEKYVNCLSHVVRDYLPELLRDDVPKTLPSETHSIFSNIQLLHTFHEEELLPSLRSAGNDFATLGKIFTDNEDKFNLYIEYYINKSKSSDLTPEHRAFFARKQFEVHEKHALSTFLLEPIQRMPRYEMLLGQLVNKYKKYYAEVSSQDDTYARISPVSWSSSAGSEPELVLGCLKDAYTMIKKILKTVNDRIALDNIEECEINLKKQGELILQNEFTVTDSMKHKQQLRCFLFEKVLFFSTICRLQPKKEKYTYHDAIFMTNLGLTPPEDDKSDRFTVWYQKRTQSPYIIETRGEILCLWVKEISELLWKQAEIDKERLMSMRKPRPPKVIESAEAPCNIPVFLNAESESPTETIASVDKCALWRVFH